MLGNIRKRKNLTQGEQDYHPAWFLSSSRCHVTGLPITHQKTLHLSCTNPSCYLEIAKLGRNFLLVRVTGYMHKQLELQRQAFKERYLKECFAPGDKIIMIEDYEKLQGSDAETRKIYLEFGMSKFAGVVIYNLNSLMRLGYKLYKRMRILPYDAYAAKDYNEAIHVALKFLCKHDPENPVCKNDFPEAHIFTSINADTTTDHYSFTPKLSKSFKARVASFLFRPYANALLEYLNKINWADTGIPEPDSSLLSNFPMKQVVDAVDYCKAELDEMFAQQEAALKMIRDREKRLRMIIEQARVGIFEYDFSKERISSANPAFLEASGYDNNELMQVDPFSIFPSESDRSFFDLLYRLSTRGDDADEDAGTCMMKTKTKETRWVILSPEIEYDNDGIPKKANVIVSDITEFKKMESSLLLYQARLRQLALQITKTSDSQRRNLEKTLDKTIGMRLISAISLISKLEAHAGADHPEIHEIRQELQRIYDQVSGIRSFLNPLPLKEGRIIEAIEDLGRQIQHDHGINVTVAGQVDISGLDKDNLALLFRSVQELMHNAVKHSKATGITVAINKENKWLSICVSDDGTGFDPARNAQGHNGNQGLGLLNVAEKMRHLGGTLEIETAPGKGTKAILKVKLP